MRRRCVPGTLALVLLLVAGLLMACGGATDANQTAPTPTAESVAEVEPSPTPEPTATPVAAPTAPSSTTTAHSSTSEEDLLALGERIFKEEAAPGVGCQLCHGPDAKGDIGPNIRGKTPGDIEFALESVDAMSFLNLSQEKVEAVSAYLQWLATQP